MKVKITQTTHKSKDLSIIKYSLKYKAYCLGIPYWQIFYDPKYKLVNHTVFCDSEQEIVDAYKEFLTTQELKSNKSKYTYKFSIDCR